MTPARRGRLGLAACVTILAVGLTACSGGTAQPGAAPSVKSTTPAAPPTRTAPTPAPSQAAADPVSIPAFFDRAFIGDRLHLGRVRDRTGSFTSYDMTYRSEGLRISGVVNVPDGPGPFPAVVLGHGAIDRDAYVRGQGMTRERDRLADAGYVAMHVDYRNHAESDDDPALESNLHLGYAVDLINAVQALKAADLPVADDRIAMMGRSMGGIAVLQAFQMAPGVARAGILYSAQSSVEAQNYEQWGGPGSDWYAEAARLHGAPAQDPGFWDGVSARRYVSRVTEPVLMIHGTRDEQCPPPWATATHEALRGAGVDAQLAWFEGEQHAFGPRFDSSMRRAVRFLDRRMTRGA